MLAVGLLYAGLVAYYMPPVGFAAYICALLCIQKFDTSDLFMVLSILLSFLFLLPANDAILVADQKRYFFGFIIFYLAFKNTGPVSSSTLGGIVFLAALATLGEALVINLVDIEFFNSIPAWSKYYQAYDVSRLEGYVRPLSFGANTSISSSLLVILLLASNAGVTLMCFGFIAIASAASLTGLVGACLLLLRNVLKRQRRSVELWLLILILVPTIIASLTFGIAEIDATSSRFSQNYITYIVMLKLEQIVMYVNDMSLLQLLFGAPGKFYGGDFVILSFFVSEGLIMVFLTALFVISRMNPLNAFAVSLIFFLSFHYGVVFSISGQILTGYLLSVRKDVVVPTVMPTTQTRSKLSADL